MINILLNHYNFHEPWANETLKHVIKPNHKVLIVPFSFGDSINSNESWQQAYDKKNGSYYFSLIEPFLHYGISEGHIFLVNYYLDKKSQFLNYLSQSDIIFFTGGFPDLMMKRLIEFDVVHEIEQFKGIIMGSSAGAMIQIKDYHITPDEDYPCFSYETGLNLIRDFDIEVHYQATALQEAMIQKVIHEKRKPVYAITDQGGILVEEKRVVFLGEVKKVDL